jgi:CYTH domain-containing protein
VELTHPDQPIELPPWVGQEVSDNPRYLNANLVDNPFTLWKN